MPIKVWTDMGGELASEVLSNWDRVITVEEHRSLAEDLDCTFDDSLDLAAANLRSQDVSDVRDAFKTAHIVGTTFRDCSLLDDVALRKEPRRFVWYALAKKSRIGVRSDGRKTETWRGLRPASEKPVRREGGRGNRRGRGDHFEMCHWLAEQEYDDAHTTFGGSIRNVWQMYDGPTLEPIGVRQAVLSFLAALSPSDRERVTAPKAFPELMKALKKRWPARGVGSAIKPVHLDQPELDTEIAELLAFVVS